jgi:citrate synthase
MSTNSSYIPGLEGIVASQTAISMVDGQNGRLVYEGYVIADLAEEMSFEEVAFLLWEGRLPNRAELEALSLELAANRSLTQAANIALDALPSDTDPMDVLRSIVSVQGVEHKLEKPSIALAVHATASFPTILAMFYRRQLGLDRAAARPRPRGQLPVHDERQRVEPRDRSRAQHLPRPARRPRHERIDICRACHRLDRV